MTAYLERSEQRGTSCARKLQNTSGASIAIALIFFLICAVVGSLVLTAASINARAVATHRDTQQAEYTVSSAAQLVATQLAPQQANPTTLTWKYGSEKIPESMDWGGDSVPELLKQIWEGVVNDQFKDIWAARNDKETYHLGGSSTSFLTIAASGGPSSGFANVFAWVSVDRDFNITVRLSTDSNPSAVSDYDQVVTAQCVPTYDRNGKLTVCQWNPAVISKARGA